MNNVKVLYFHCAVEKTLVGCVSNCTLECQSTHFSGTDSFSQLSAKNINLTLSKKRSDAITNDFLTAVELIHRINHDIALIEFMITLYENTSSQINRITRFVEATVAFNSGFNKIISKYASVDMSRLRNLIVEYLHTYNNAHKFNRNRAADYISQAIRQIQDLNFEIETAPTFFSTLYEAHRFYTSLLFLLDKCLSHIQLASSYLSRAQNAEINISLLYSPDKFYHNDSESVLCNGKYSSIIQLFDKIVPFLSYMSSKLFRWIQNNTDKNILSTASIVASQLKETFVNDAIKSNNESISDAIPNLWYMLECVECNVTSEHFTFSLWSSFVKNVTDTMSNEIVSCLLQYEQMLKVIYDASSQQLLPLPPKWKLAEMLSTFIGNLELYSQSLKTLSHAVISGTVTMQETIATCENILKFLSDNMVSVENRITSSAQTWQDDIVLWQSELETFYYSVAQVILQLNQFMPNNANLTTVTRNLRFWTIADVVLNVIYYDTNPLPFFDPVIQEQFNQNLTDFLTKNAASFIHKIVSSRIINTNLLKAQRQNEAFIQAHKRWSNFVDDISQVIAGYVKFFVVDESFIQLVTCFIYC